jgi:dipeptidyl aminopeptidase/acylaminoacyl peptidase
VATAAHGAGDANWYIAQLYAIDVASGKVKSLYTPPVDMQIAVPRWSPDGENIAFIGGLMSDEGNTGGDIFALPAKGGKPQNLTPNLKASPSWLAWVSSSQILFSEQIDGESGLEILDTSDGKVTRLWKSQESNSTGGWTFGVSPARDGKTCALLLQGFQQPPEIWAGPIGAWKPVTHANRSLQPMWGKAESLHWSSEGCNIQGWLVYPRDYDPSRHYPLVVKVHGGPGDALRPNWPEVFFSITPLSYAGYFVLFPNPRGSFGQGEAFTRANVNDFGGGDLRDILAGIDAVEKEVPVDDSRIGIVGWSYGGFMTMWAVTQTNRFHAAVAGAGIANWLSYYGENYIDLWMRPFFGASVYDDPVVYAQRSPINFIKNVKTPTLILVGERDEECPVPQSLEFWHALKTLGVPNQFVVYPGEGHQIRQPVHQRDILERTIAWFNKYLQ